MRFNLLFPTILIAFSAPAYADDPTVVGTLMGVIDSDDVFYDPPDVGDVTGEELNLGDHLGADVTYSLGPGEVNVLRPGTTGPATSRDPRLAVGFAPGATATLNIDGAGAQLEMQGAGVGLTADIGARGTGTVNLSDGGGLVLSDPANVNGSSSASIQIGKENGNGSLNVDDGFVSISSALDAFLFVGANSLGTPNSGGGTARVSISNGAALNINALAPIAPPPAGDGSDAGLVLGQEVDTTTAMTVDASNVVVSSETSQAGLSVAREAGSTGTFLLDDGASLSITASTTAPADTARFEGAFLVIGRDDRTNGSMTVANGSTVAMTAGTDIGFVGIGRNEGSFGRLTVEGGSSFSYTDATDNGVMLIGQDDPSASNGGVGIVTVTGMGSEIDFDGRIGIGAATGAGLSTGLLTVTDGAEVRSDLVEIYRGGVLNGSGGTIVSDVDLLGGTLAPGTSPGTLTIDGDLRLAAGTLQVEIGGTGPGQFDVLSILGDLIVEDFFDLDVRFIDGFTPEAGDSFEFLDIAGSTDDLLSFANVSFLGAPGVTGTLGGGQGAFALTAQVAPIPLPAAGWLLGVALGGVVMAGRRRSVPVPA